MLQCLCTWQELLLQYHLKEPGEPAAARQPKAVSDKFDNIRTRTLCFIGNMQRIVVIRLLRVDSAGMYCRVIQHLWRAIQEGRGDRGAPEGLEILWARLYHCHLLSPALDIIHTHHSFPCLLHLVSCCYAVFRDGSPAFLFFPDDRWVPDSLSFQVLLLGPFHPETCMDNIDVIHWPNNAGIIRKLGNK